MVLIRHILVIAALVVFTVPEYSAVGTTEKVASSRNNNKKRPYSNGVHTNYKDTTKYESCVSRLIADGYNADDGAQNQHMAYSIDSGTTEYNAFSTIGKTYTRYLWGVVDTEASVPAVWCLFRENKADDQD